MLTVCQHTAPAKATVTEAQTQEAKRLADVWAAEVTAFLLTDDDPTILETLATHPKLRCHGL